MCIRDRYVINLYPSGVFSGEAALSYGEDYYSYEKYEGRAIEYKWRVQDEGLGHDKYRTYIKEVKTDEYIYRDYETGEVVKKTDLKTVFNSEKFPYGQTYVVEGPITYQGRRFLKTKGIKIPEEPEDIKTAEDRCV